MEGIPFKEHSFELNPGDSLFVYTDGVLKNVRAGVDGFVREAEQFDDLTMLCFRYIGSGNK